MISRKYLKDTKHVSKLINSTSAFMKLKHFYDTKILQIIIMKHDALKKFPVRATSHHLKSSLSKHVKNPKGLLIYYILVEWFQQTFIKVNLFVCCIEMLV